MIAVFLSQYLHSNTLFSWALWAFGPAVPVPDYSGYELSEDGLYLPETARDFLTDDEPGG